MLLATVALIWGSSFLWVAIGLESLGPGAIVFLRLLLGGIALACFRPARQPVDRSAWPTILVIAICGNAGPGLFLAFAQQRVESSVAGMINATAPLTVLVVSIVMLGRSPGRRQVTGLLIGFVGIAAMSIPNLIGAEAQPIGMLLLFGMVMGYGISNNLIVPLQQRYGAPAIVMRALLIGSLLLAPWGIVDLASSSPTTSSIAAVVILGVLGTGVARALSGTLAGRTGASRGAMITYFATIVAIILGVTFRNETIGPLELLGTTLILGGAYLTSRPQT